MLGIVKECSRHSECPLGDGVLWDYNGRSMRHAIRFAILVAMILSKGNEVLADTVYRCGLKNGAPWFTFNVRPRGVKCVPVGKPSVQEPHVPGARCTVQRFRDTSFYRCEKDGIVWLFNRNREVAGRKSTAVASPPRTGAGDDIQGDATGPEDARGSADLDAIVAKAAELSGVPEDLIRAVIYVESRFRVDAVSPAGAQGLMQLMPVTAQALSVEDPFDPEQNVLAGARLLRRLADRFNGDLERTVAAYYSGAGAVQRAGGIPDESCAAYVKSVLDRYRRYAENRDGPTANRPRP